MVIVLRETSPSADGRVATPSWPARLKGQEISFYSLKRSPLNPGARPHVTRISAKHVLTRAVALFAVSVSAVAAISAPLLWHHFSIAQGCGMPGTGQDEPVTCHFRTTFFPDRLELLVLLLLYFAACILVTWLWLWARRKMASWVR